MSNVVLAKYGEQYVLTFPMIKIGVTDLAVSTDWTPATGDTKISKDQGNFANTTNNPAAVGGTGAAGWSLTLTGLELQAAVADVQLIDSAPKAVEDQYLKVVTYGHPLAQIHADLDQFQAPRPAEIQSTAFSTQTTSHLVSMPTGDVDDGDLIVIVFANVGTDVVTTPSGWVLLQSTQNVSGSGLRLSCYAKKGNPNDSGTTVDFVTAGAQRAAALSINFKKGTWFGYQFSSTNFFGSIKYGSSATGSSVSPNPPIVAGFGGVNSTFIAIEANLDGTATDTAYPANYVDRTNIVSNAASSGISLSIAFRSKAVIPLVATTEDPGVFTIPSNPWIAQTLAIRASQPTGFVDGSNLTHMNGNLSAGSNAALFWAGALADSGTAQAGDATHITLQSGASATNDYYKNAAIAITGGTGAGQTRQITGYVGSTKVATVDTAWATNPDGTSTYTILGRIV